MIAVEFPSIAWGYHVTYLLSVVGLSVLVGAVLVVFARPFVRSVVEVMTEDPRADVVGEVEAGEWRSTVRGMTR